MMYQSTRDPSHKKYTSAEVIKMGLAPDGGLFLPETIPTLSEADIEALRHESYPVRAARILHMFLTDYTQEELMTDCHAARHPSPAVRHRWFMYVTICTRWSCGTVPLPPSRTWHCRSCRACSPARWSKPARHAMP